MNSAEKEQLYKRAAECLSNCSADELLVEIMDYLTSDQFLEFACNHYLGNCKNLELLAEELG